MEVVKDKQVFKHDIYDVQISPFSEKRLSISIIDKISKAEFFQKDLTLSNIGCSTLAKAFQKTKKEISVSINSKKGGEIQILQIKVIVQSAFLKPVQEIIYLKKVRDVGEGEILKREMDCLNKKLKDIKADQKYNEQKQYIYEVREKEQNFAGSSGYQTYSQITLPKGKYLITWTLLAKTQTQVLYMYMNSGQIQVFPNCYCYIPQSGNSFVPITFRKQYTVSLQSQTLSLQTYYSISHPIKIRNCIVTAKKLS